MIPAKEVVISPAAELAIAWLESMTDEDGGVHRGCDATSGQLGSVSTEITGYAAHLFAWLALITGKSVYRDRCRMHAGWLCNLWLTNGGKFLPFEPESNLTYFFDTGIVARALALTSQAVRYPTLDLCEQIARYMEGFQDETIFRPVCDRNGQHVIPNPGHWSSEPGYYQLKAGLIWRTLHLPSLYAKLYETMPVNESYPGTDPGDAQHPRAYTVEAQLLSGHKAEAMWSMLHIAPWKHMLFRCDALCQRARIGLVLEENMFDMLEGLHRIQSPSGGFWFARLGSPWQNSQHLSTHATIFAIQALVMGDLKYIPDYRELTIV